MSIGAVEIIAAAAVTIVLYLVPAVLARRIKHGEARFGSDGKMIDDE